MCFQKSVFDILTVHFGNRLLRVGKHLYKDPTTYHAVDDAVQDFANELDIEDLCIGQILGGGEFAEVYRGTLRRNMKKVDVAIKTLQVINVFLRNIFNIKASSAFIVRFGL